MLTKKNPRIFQTKLQQHSQDCKQTSTDRPCNRAPRYGFPDRQRLHQHPHFTCVLPWRCHRKRSQALASDEQLKYLSTAKTLFIDGTFKMVCKPFVQLLSIHFFAKHEDNMKQLPGIFVLMSRKRKKEKLQEGTSTYSETASIATSRERLVADFEETGYGEP